MLRKMMQNILRRKSTLSPIDRIKIQHFSYNLGAYRRLIKFGLNNFDDQGRILIEDDITHKQEKMSGAFFIKDTITYFEQEDTVSGYKYCAQLNKLLDEHRKKFK